MKTLRHLAATKIPIGTILNERENVVVGNVLYEMTKDSHEARKDLEAAEEVLTETVHELSDIIKKGTCGDSAAMRMAMEELMELYESIQYWRYDILKYAGVDYGFAEMETIIQRCIVRPPAFLSRVELSNVLRGILSAWDDDMINIIDHTSLMESHAILHGFILDYITIVRQTYAVFCDKNYVYPGNISMWCRKVHISRIMRDMKREIFTHICEEVERVRSMVREDPPEGAIATLRYKCVACGDYYDGTICCPDMVHIPITDYETA